MLARPCKAKQRPKRPISNFLVNSEIFIALGCVLNVEVLACCSDFIAKAKKGQKRPNNIKKANLQSQNLNLGF